MQLIANGVQWYYLSYDHKKAMEENKTKPPEHLPFRQVWVSDEIKQQYPLWRIGKLRILRFDPDGMIKRMYIGRMYKYAKCFFPNQVGVDVKPIIHPNCDDYGLIQAGLAVDETQIKV